MRMRKIKFLWIILFLCFDVQASELGRSYNSDRLNGAQSDLHSPLRASEFVRNCVDNGGLAKICREMTSPNKNSRSTFHKVYGNDTEFYLVPEDQDVWEIGYELARLASRYSDSSSRICELRNWYRPNFPKDYNGAVGGAQKSSHINGSGIDIEFCSVSEKYVALKKMRRDRKETGAPVGIGTYGSGSKVIHIDFKNRLYGKDVWR
jgi:hypothetical protein